MVLLRAALLLLAFPLVALADEPTSEAASEPSAPQAKPESKPAIGKKLGGHVGLGMPFLSVGTGGSSFIGRDFSSLGIVAGINIGFDAHWSIDMEFIVVANFHPRTLPGARMTFVLDPGVIYNFGPLWAGLRMAMRVGGGITAAEFGFIPIVGKAFTLTDGLAYYVELDLPMFIQSPNGFNFNVFLQTGLGF